MPDQNVRARFTLGLDYEAAIPASFAIQLREAAQREDATPFIKEAVALHPENDIDLCIYVIGENIRLKVRRFILAQLNNGGLAGQVSPIRHTLAELPEILELNDVRETGSETAGTTDTAGSSGGQDSGGTSQD